MPKKFASQPHVVASVPDAELGGHTKHVVAPFEALKKLLVHWDAAMAPVLAE